jgi:hypothetical protein
VQQSLFRCCNSIDRLLDEAESSVKKQPSKHATQHIPIALHNLDKALNKLQQRRPKLHCKELRKQIDQGTALMPKSQSLFLL